MNYFQQCPTNVSAMNVNGNNYANLKTQKIQENNNDRPFAPEEAFMLGNYFSSLYVPYCGLTNYPVQPQNPRQACLVQLMMLEFNLHELNLYLDTHPNDKEALQQFQQFRQAVIEARTNYEKQYGPLLVIDVCSSEAPWVWNQGPWPWQRQ